MSDPPDNPEPRRKLLPIAKMADKFGVTPKTIDRWSQDESCPSRAESKTGSIGTATANRTPPPEAKRAP